MTLLDRVHKFLEDKLHVSPKVADPVIAAAVAIAASWIATGSFDATELRLAAAAAIYGLIGFAAPPTVGLSQRQVRRFGR